MSPLVGGVDFVLLLTRDLDTASEFYERAPGAEFETGSLHFDDVAAARSQLEGQECTSRPTRSTAASATWRSSAIRTAAR